jgi:hypothetical protein
MSIPTRLDRNGVEVVVGHDDVLVLLDLVALDDVLEVDLLPVDRAHALHADAPHVLVVELIEPQGLLLGRRVHGDRDRDEAERDGPLPHRSGWHKRSSVLWAVGAWDSSRR